MFVNPLAVDYSAGSPNSFGFQSGWTPSRETVEYGVGLKLNGSDSRISYSTHTGITGSNNSVAIVGFTTGSTSDKGAFIKVGDSSSGFGLGVGGSTFDDAGNDLIGLKEAVAWQDTGTTVGKQFNVACYLQKGSVSALFLNGDATVLGFNGSAPVSPSAVITIGGYTAGANPRWPTGYVHFFLVGLVLDQTADFEISNQILPAIRHLFPARTWSRWNPNRARVFQPQAAAAAAGGNHRIIGGWGGRVIAA